MKLLSKHGYEAERAVIADAISFEGARIIADDDDICAVDMGVKKIVVRDMGDFPALAEKYGLYGDVCILGAPLDLPEAIGMSASPCVTFAYLNDLPPAIAPPVGTSIKKLAPTLAGVVASSYGNRCGGYTEDEMKALMRERSVFGAITDGRLSGFIGRHHDGSMGMLTVYPEFSRRGIGAALEGFMAAYVMTFGRTPFCDVFADNAASIALQHRLGLTPSRYYTFWGEYSPRSEKA